MKTKTKEFKELKVREIQYLCQQQMDITCETCPLRINIDKPNYQIKGCYYLIKMELNQIDKKEITF